MHLCSFLFAGYFVILSNVALIVLGQYFNPSTAELFVCIVHSFEPGIANTISSFK